MDRFNKIKIHLETMLPVLVWNKIAGKLDATAFINFRVAFPELSDAITTTNCVQSLFPAVFKVMYQKAYVSSNDAKICRCVCKKWSSEVDDYFQTKNFESLENIDGAKNPSAFVMKLPLRLVDIHRIYQLDLHPRCISFGKKLTLKLDFGGMFHGVYRVYHRNELCDLVNKVTKLWQHFEHLEIAYGDDVYTPIVVPRPGDMPLIDVPFGDLGVPETISKINIWETVVPSTGFSLPGFDPDRFDMLIPFIHHLKNLKTVTFLTRCQSRIFHILLHIPNTNKLEKIFIGGTYDMINHNWANFLSLVYAKCSSKLTFLSGCPAQSLLKFYEKSDENDDRIRFENLTELHVTVRTLVDVEAISRLTREIQQKESLKLCPKLLILEVRIESPNVHINGIDILYQFAELFPTLRHFCLAGLCLTPHCTTLQDIYHGKLNFKVNNDNDINNKSKVTTFQIECPSHVPVFLMRKFSMLKNVIVAEQTTRCSRRTSKAYNKRYIRRFFDLFNSNVRTLTFVPPAYIQAELILLFEPGAITHYRNDKKFHRRKRKLAIGTP